MLSLCTVLQSPSHFFIIGILIEEKIWNLKVVSIFIFLMAQNTEHSKQYLLAICVSSFRNCLFIDRQVSYLSVCLIFTVFIQISTLCPRHSWESLFFHCAGCLFTQMIVSFAMQKFLGFIQFHLLTLRIISCPIRAFSERFGLSYNLKCIPSFFFFFAAAGFKLRSLAHFNLIFCVVKNQDLIILLQLDIQFCQQHLLNRMFLFQCMFLMFLSNIR